jgi:hypothetical protein
MFILEEGGIHMVINQFILRCTSYEILPFPFIDLKHESITASLCEVQAHG